MNWSLSTVSFRYYLYSYDQVVRMAKDCGFTAIELWEPHLTRHSAEFEQRISRESEALPIAIMSAYLDITNPNIETHVILNQMYLKAVQCQKIGAGILRLFTGKTPSAQSTDADWKLFEDRLIQINRLAAFFKLTIVFETHPNTYLDSYISVTLFLEILKEHNLNHLGLNFDVFHVWEFGVRPLACLREWFPFVKHVHLKNAVKATDDFKMENVYSPMKKLEDCTSICEGVVNVQELVQELKARNYSGHLTLEWFGEVSPEFLKSQVETLNSYISSKSPDRSSTRSNL